MSVFAINQKISDLGLEPPKIFYDFDSFSGGNVNSIQSGDSNYSGSIINYNSSFKDQASGSGFFNGQYIQIQNTTGIQSEAATIIFSQQKTGISNGTIFSHLDSSGPSGWEVGINQANKLYYKNYVNGSPNYHTLGSYLSDKNLCAITVSEFGSVGIHRLNFQNKPETSFVDNFITNENPGTQNVINYNFDSEEFSVLSHSISNGSTWNIGSGEFLYKGYMDSFLYFDSELNKDQLRNIARSIYADYQVVADVSGTISGQITGYQVSGSGVSGEMGTSFNVSGTGTQSGYYTYESGAPQTGSVGISGVVYVPYTGIDAVPGTEQIDQKVYKKVVNLSYVFEITGDPIATGLSNYQSSGSYWNFSGHSGSFYNDTGVGNVGEIFGITGFDIVEVTGYTTGVSIPIINTGTNSGVLYSGYQYTPLRAPDESYLISGSYIDEGENEDPSYFANSITLINKFNDEGLYELIYDIETNEFINNQLDLDLNGTYSKITAQTPQQITAEESEFFINGVSTFTGELTLGKDQYNFPTYNVVSGFAISGFEVFTELNLEDTDNIILDYNKSGDKNSLTIQSLTGYDNIPFTSFDFNDKQVFFNGVKLYSGVDYIYDNGFYPVSDAVTGSTGVFFTYDNYSGAQDFIGSANQGISISHNSINPNRYICFLNGIRQPVDNIIEHAQYSDLISGTKENVINSQIYLMNNGIEDL